MRALLQQYLFFVTSIFLVARFLPGLSYGNSLEILLESSLILFIVHFSVRPIVNLIALPINVLTLGVFSFLVNGLMIYLVALVIPSFRVTSFYFPAVSLSVIRVNSFEVGTILSYVVIAFFISVVRDFLLWLCSK